MKFLFAILMLALAVTGCTTKSKARLKEQSAFLAGQNAALRQQAQASGVTIVGAVQNPQVPWVAGLTLAQAVATANYTSAKEPKQIIITRQAWCSGRSRWPDRRRDMTGEGNRVYGSGAPGPSWPLTGISMSSVVPPPTGLVTSSVPPSASIRSRSPVSPDPRAGSAPPVPSSRTVSRTIASSAPSSTCTTEARACLAALATASDTA